MKHITRALEVRQKGSHGDYSAIFVDHIISIKPSTHGANQNGAIIKTIDGEEHEIQESAADLIVRLNGKGVIFA